MNFSPVRRTILRSACCVTMAICASTGFGAETSHLVSFQLTSAKSTVAVGEIVRVDVVAADLRADPLGIYSAYLDLNYPGAKLRLVREQATFGPGFGQFGTLGGESADGMDEVGSLATGTTATASEGNLLLSVFFEAISPGEALIATGPADLLPLHAITLKGGDSEVPVTQVQYGTTLIYVIPEPGAIRLLMAGCVAAYCMSRRRRCA
jgi:hypothetical protein